MYKQVNAAVRTVPDEVVRRLGAIDPATLSDAMGRHGAMSHRIRPLRPGPRLSGRALTVKCPAGDNLMVHKALQLGKPGDVLVIDTGLSYEATVMGRNMSLYARHIGFRGAVIDGTVRDTVALRQMDDYHIYCVGSTPRSAVKHAMGSVNVPVNCGDVVVHPGDIIVGDDDGVSVVPRDIAAEVANAAEERLEMEDQQALDVVDDDLPLEILYGAEWVDERLAGPLGEPFQIRGYANPED